MNKDNHRTPGTGRPLPVNREPPLHRPKTPAAALQGDDAVPVLDDVVLPGKPLAAGPRPSPRAAVPGGHQSKTPAAVDLEAHRARLLERISPLLEDLAADLQAELGWKTEKIIKQAVESALREALAQGAETLRQSILTQLKLMLPDILASLDKRSPPPDHTP